MPDGAAELVGAGSGVLMAVLLEFACQAGVFLVFEETVRPAIGGVGA